MSVLITPLSDLVENGKILNPEDLPRPIIFLSGTTNFNNDETRWQQTLIDSILNVFPTIPSTDNGIETWASLHSPTIIDPYNPTWDSTWREDPSDNKFVEQVAFESHGLEIADIVVVGFMGPAVRGGKVGAGGSALVELGIVLERGGEDRMRIVVGVEEGFWKKGYVRVLCERFGVRCTGGLEELVAAVMEELVGCRV